MSLFKKYQPSKNPKLIPERSAPEVCRMYKHFTAAPESGEQESFYLTQVLLSNGYVFSRKTPKSPTSSPISKHKSGAWTFEHMVSESTAANPNLWRYDLMSKGWKLPRGYWTGPRELRPEKYNEPSESLLKKLDKRDKDNELTKQWESLRAKKYGSRNTRTARKERAELQAENKLTEPQEQKKILKAIPSLLNSEFWNLPAKSQLKLLREWGYQIETLDSTLESES